MGEKVKTIRFFSGSDTHRFLSNFHPVYVEFDGVSYPSVEHAFQAAKTMDKMQREFIRLASTPARAKQLGFSVRLRQDWDNGLKLRIMKDLLRQKFSNPRMRNLLRETGDAVLIHVGDIFWGEVSGLKSENHLGKLLMRIREENNRDDQEELLQSNKGEEPNT